MIKMGWKKFVGYMIAKKSWNTRPIFLVVEEMEIIIFGPKLF